MIIKIQQTDFKFEEHQIQWAKAFFESAGQREDWKKTSKNIDKVGKVAPDKVGGKINV